MKKIIMICLAMTLVLSLSLTALAAPGGFLESPSNNGAPEVIEVITPEGCTAQLVITPYNQRDTLEADRKEAIEDAYSNIKANQNVAKLNEELAALAKAQDIKEEELAVSDLFDVNYINCDHDAHQQHGKITVKLKADTLEGFVGLMAYVDGKWQLIEGATVENGVLTFDTDVFGPYAIVVKKYVEPPKTGDTSLVYLWGILAVVSAAAVVFCIVKMKKSGAKN